MGYNLKGRNFLKVADFSERELLFLLDLARDLKRARYAGTEEMRFVGKVIAVMFEKASTRTRSAFETAAYHQGMAVTYLDPASSHVGKKETMKDTARVLGRMFDGISFRGFAHSMVEEMGQYAGVPVWNALTDEWHPTQVMADYMTMIEYSSKPIHEISYAFLGDAKNNMGHSLLLIGSILGSDVRIVAPKENQPSDEVIAMAQERAKESGARITITDNIDEGVKGVDYLHTDVWVSMGEPDDVWGAAD